MIINTQTFKQLSEYAFRKTYPNISFPEILTDDILEQFGYAILHTTQQPEYDEWYHTLSEGTPEQKGDEWYQTWVLTPVTHTPEEEIKRLETLKTNKINQIDQETSLSILSGFNYTINDQEYHFSYDAFDQQNFSDTANMCQLALSGVEGLPKTVTWNSYLEDGTLVQQEFDAESFLKLYTSGAMVHKASKMQIGGQRKLKVAEAQSEEELDQI